VCEYCDYYGGQEFECECIAIDIISLTSNKEIACVGCEIEFEVTLDPELYDCVDWEADGDADPCYQAGEQTFTTKWDSPTSQSNDTSVTVYTCYDYEDDQTEKSKEVTIVEVDSLEPDEGTEIDDGDSDPNTKLFVVCIASPNPPSTLTVTATPNPSVSEDDLPDGWNLTGGTGTGKLTRTVDKTTAGETVITCTCGADSEKITTIWVVRGDISLSSSNTCDGAEVDVDLVVTVSIKNHLTGVQFTATEPVGVTNYGSPSGQGLTFSQRSADITEWKIDNARWYSTQQDHCNDDADWELEATYEIAGSHNCSTNYDPTSAVVFTASASAGPGNCLDGGAQPTNLWSGAPTYTTTENPPVWETTVAVGTFVRDVQATSWWNVVGGPASQYYDMVKDEEQFHEGQFEGTTSNILDDLWDPQLIMNAVNANEPYVGATQAASLLAAQNAFNAARVNEQTRSAAYLVYPHPRRCAVEAEAKTAAGSSHRAAMPCTYPACP